MTNAPTAPEASSLAWFKSSYSSEEGGACIEVAYDWRKSSYSGTEGGNCVEVAAHPEAIHVRDSKAGEHGPTLTLIPAAWAHFTTHTAAPKA
ncbi:DUF397 domain-containing protein [Streptomyces iconiensis]|uniref:DUF397 domain-containing protein n=1 Tax=Streptomyces iconiensis TaxID=1384038 RepID=A0ABT7A4A4_9ACTN|nr:DUF397 domain-containing protein [Streptomyces iconiensis]MDJ1136131.1 DUF397 domain-containing protein [Streptomyces iconiensis]